MSIPSRTIDPHHAQILYEENAKVAATFWEWRNKLLAFCFTAAGALFAVAGWLYAHDERTFAAFPLVVGAIISIGCIKLEQRNHLILSHCYQIGAAIEKTWTLVVEAPLETGAGDSTDDADGAGTSEPTATVARQPARLRQSLTAADPDPPTSSDDSGAFTMLASSRRTYFRTMRLMFLAVAILQLSGACFAIYTAATRDDSARASRATHTP